ncbi:MAG: Ig-like domain-containing domain, partial [Planctomycetota bacterium]
MYRKLAFLVLIAVFGLSLSVQAATIEWVSDNKGDDNSDQGFVDLLRTNGYTVNYRGEDGATDLRYWRILDAGKIAELEAADLIIVSRDTDSGSFASDATEVANWNGVTTPLILQPAHIYRSNRWIWMDSESTGGTTANLLAVLPEHFIFNGVTLDGSNQVSIISLTSNVGGGTDPGNGTLIGTRADNGGVWIAEWEEGVEFYTGSGQTAGGPRMYFAAGGNAPDGTYNLTAEGEKLFLNAVNYMITGGVDPHIALEPNPADGAENVSIETNLTWTRGDGAKWDQVYFGTDPCDANLTLAATIPDFQAAEYDPGDPNLRPSTTYYWYITEVNGPNNYPGPVWSFSTIPGEAQCQFPVDGAVIPGDPYPPIPTILYTELVFSPGSTAVKHTGYLSKVRDKVANRAEDANLGSPPLGHYSGYEYKYFAGHPAFYPFEG